VLTRSWAYQQEGIANFQLQPGIEERKGISRVKWKKVDGIYGNAFKINFLIPKCFFCDVLYVYELRHGILTIQYIFI